MDPPVTPDYYADLGVENNATLDVIKKAHRKLVLQVHPDRQAPGTCSDAHAFRKVQEAFEVLRDDTTRSEYDKQYPDKRPKEKNASADGERKRPNVSGRKNWLSISLVRDWRPRWKSF
ncbi:hypothetical protein CGLO_05841 [Colletotrichum gloeosporioides Cg-14]|uniref:J domain-containing protein n=1 Tax=Colletotrichum gloeosporioides (strain Cg-14) TaxID=1237896 RepID=T0M0K3_COLGC|nr:hypothetical protein CGLO_05841 [Colletotrichum gloeosporioides Cg-14]